MASILVDSSVLLDVATSDARWAGWSARNLWQARESADILINAIVYAEVSAAFERIEEVDAFLLDVGARREDVPWTAAYAAGRIHKSYLKAGGQRRTPLPDFFIAAHAALCGYQLLTRDADYFRNYFPRLSVIHPEGHA
ncbi:MAG: type II toxin-antitoxin system VapC family toxin [Hyphomicrobiales bacterium]